MHGFDPHVYRTSALLLKHLDRFIGGAALNDMPPRSYNPAPKPY